MSPSAKVSRAPLKSVIALQAAAPRKFAVGGFVHQRVHRRHIVDAQAVEPALALRIGVDARRMGNDILVDFDDFASDRRADFGGRLDRFENGGALARLQSRADLRQFDEDEIADLPGGMTGDADDGDIAIELEPFMGAGEFQHDASSRVASNIRTGDRPRNREHTQCSRQSCGGRTTLDSTVESALRW